MQILPCHAQAVLCQHHVVSRRDTPIAPQANRLHAHGIFVPEMAPNRLAGRDKLIGGGGEIQRHGFGSFLGRVGQG